MIGILAHRLDALFFRKNSFQQSLCYLIPEGHDWLAGVLKGKCCLFFKTTKHLSLEDCSDDDILRHSNLTALLKKNGVTSFMTSHRGSAFLAKWAKDNRILLLGTNPKHQIYFEHKIHFDALLKKLSLPSPASRIIKGPQKPGRPPFVVQDPSSFGSFGTFIIKSDKAWTAIRSLLSPNRLYLAREFVSGPSYGITIYIDNYRIALSAIRQQCFFRGTSTFAGIQWKKTSSFKKKTIEHINRSLLHLACKLQDEGFFGFANIDFIIAPDGLISILECNPRLSSASPHLFGVPETFGGLPIADLYLSMGEFSDPPPFFFFGVPDASYEGALLDVINTTTIRLPSPPQQSGTYEQRETPRLITHAIPDLDTTKQVLCYYDHRSTTATLAPGAQCGTVISSFPLFNNQGTLLERGRAAHLYFLHGQDS